MPLGLAVRRITTLLLSATLVPTPGLAWPAPVVRMPGIADAFADRVFLTALNSTEQMVMSGPGRPQLYLVFNVSLPVPPAGPSILNANTMSWFNDFLSELQKQPVTSGPATVAAPAESILDEIAAGDAHIRSMTSATQLASMPDRLPFDGSDNVPVTRTIGVAIEDALQEAGFANDGSRRVDKNTGAVIYEGQTADGDIKITGQLVNGQIELRKEFSPLTGSGEVGEPVRIRATGAPTVTNASSTTNTSPVVNTTTTTDTTTTNTATTAAKTTPPATPIRTITSTPASVLSAPVAGTPSDTPGVHIVPGDGTPGESVRYGQPFQVVANVPAAGAPPVLHATLTTPDGQQQTVVLVPQGTRNGMAHYGSPHISFHGGRIAQGTLQGLDVTNGQIVTATVQGAGGGTTQTVVYTDDVQQGIARVNEALTATFDELVRQRNFVDAQMKNPAIASDPAQIENLKQWRADIDRKMTFITQTRQVMAGTDLPGLQLMYGQRRFDWLTSNWDDFDPRVWYGDTVIREQFKERMGELFTDVMTGFTMGAYQQVARMSMIAQFRTVFTGYNEFNQKLTYEQLLAENKGLAFDLAMFWLPGKYADFLANGKISGELVVSAGAPGGRIFVPSRPAAFAGGSGTTSGGTGTPAVAGAKPPVLPPTAGTPPNTAATGADAPTTPGATSTPRTTTAAGDKTQAFPEPVNPTGNIDGKPGAKVKPVSETAQVAHEVETTAELKVVYDEAVVNARAAGVPDSRIQQLTAKAGPGHQDSINALYLETLKAEGKVTMSTNEFGQASTFATRNTLGTLTDADYNWLRERLAADPNYLDGLPKRGVMDPADGFIPPVNNEQLGDLMKNPRVAGMVDEAKTAAAANNTPTVMLPPGSVPSAGTPNVAGAADNAGTVILPPGSAATADTTGTVILPPGSLPKPGTPTVQLGPGATAPTVQLGPRATAPTVQLGPGATAPTVQLGPGATAPTVRMDPNATARMTNELMQSLPKAQQSGATPQQMANSVRGMMSKLGVGPQQLVNSLRQRLTPRPVSMSGLGNPATAASRTGVDVSLEATGVSSGVAFNVRATNASGAPIQVQGEGIVVEPVRAAPSQPASTNRAQAVTAQPQVATQPVEAFCLERAQPVAAPGTEYRVAPPAVQARHRGLVDVLHAAQRVMDVGGLRPDSEIKGYFNFIRQWSIWSRQENFNEKKFTEEFLNQTKKNVEGQGVKWTNQMRDTVGKVAPGRWRDIMTVLGEVAKLKASAGSPSLEMVAAARLRTPHVEPLFRRLEEV